MIHLAFLQDIKLGQITQGDLRGKSTWQTSAKILEIRSLLLTHIKYYPLFSIYCERTVEKLGGRAGGRPAVYGLRADSTWTSLITLQHMVPSFLSFFSSKKHFLFISQPQGSVLGYVVTANN